MGQHLTLRLIPNLLFSYALFSIEPWDLLVAETNGYARQKNVKQLE